MLAVLLVAAPLSAQTVSQTRAQVPPGTAMQTAVSGNANGTAVVVSGYASVMLSVTASVAMSGGTTINFECQSNGTFGAVSALKLGTTTVATTTTTTGDFQIAVGSYLTCRARISAYSGGTMTVVGYPSVMAPASFTITSAAGGGAAVTIADGADVAQGTTTDARSTATDATGVTLMQVFKEISFMEQNPASRAVTNAGTFAVQAAQTTNPWIVAGGGTAGTAATGVVSVQGIASMTPLLVTPTTNATVNVAQLAGTATSVSSGNKDNGTLRVTIATDQVQLTNKLLTTPDLPALASTSTKQSDGTQKTQIVDGSGNVIASTSNNLNVQCANCSGSGASAVDEAVFTAGTSVFAPSGVFFQTTATDNALTNGQQGMLQATAQRAAFVNLRNASGTEIGVTATPLFVNLAQTGANASAIKVNVASGGIASGAVASGAIASGAVASGAYASGSIASGAIVDGANVVEGALADAAVTAGATGSISAKLRSISRDLVANIVLAAGTNVIGHVITDTGSTTAVTGSVAVTNAGTFAVQPAGSIAFDGGAAAVNPVLEGCYASAAAPSDVSADNDATRLWCLRNGSTVIQPSYAGVLASTGVGVAGTGTPRVTDVASGTTGSAPPTQAGYVGGVTSGATGGLLTGLILCDSQGYLDMTTATTTEIAPLVSSRTIYVCSIVAMANGTTVMTFKRGTGTNCGTGTNSISPAFDLTAQVGFTLGNGAGVVLGPAGAGTVGGATTSGNAVCVTSSANVNLHILIRYAVF